MHTIDTSFCGSAITDDVLLAMAEGWHDLERLSVRGCVLVSDTGTQKLVRFAHHLMCLNISSCRNVSEACIKSLPAHLKLLSAQMAVVETVGVNGIDDVFGSSHLRRFTA
jgi:hypothetical protein